MGVRGFLAVVSSHMPEGDLYYSLYSILFLTFQRDLLESLNSVIQSKIKSLNACKCEVAVRPMLGYASSLVQKSLFLQLPTPFAQHLNILLERAVCFSALIRSNARCSTSEKWI